MQAAPSSTRWSVLFLLLGLAVLAAGLCASCLSLSIALDSSGEVTRSAAMSYFLCFLFLALPMLAGGGASIWYGLRQRKHEKDQQLQSLILDLASKNNGAVTAAELALSSTLPMNQAQDYLEYLAARGICEMELTASGSTCFVFEHRRPLSDGDTHE